MKLTSDLRLSQITLICVVVFSFLLVGSVKVAAQPVNYVPEPTCIKRELVTGKIGQCNPQCKEQCITEGKSCKFGEPDECFSMSPVDEQQVINQQKDYREALNFFGYNMCTPDNPDCIPSLIRLAFLAILSLFGLAGAGMGLWAAYLRSLAQTAEAISNAYKMGMNAFIGLVIGFGGILIVQIVGLLTGSTQGLFDFNIFPKAGLGEKCYIAEERCLPGLVCERDIVTPGEGTCQPV